MRTAYGTDKVNNTLRLLKERKRYLENDKIKFEMEIKS